MDVEATTAVRQAEVGAAKTMLDRTADRFEVTPSRLVADAGYGSAEMVEVAGVDPSAGSNHMLKADGQVERTDGTFSRTGEFAYDPEGKRLCLPRRQRAEEIPSPLLSKPRWRRPDERTARSSHLRKKAKAAAPMRAQGKMLPEHASAQDRTLRS